MNKKFDVYGLGNALVDIVVSVEEDFLQKHNIEKGLMTLVEKDQQDETISNLSIVETNMKCGGSAANSVIAVSQFGGTSNYAFKVANDKEGAFYLKDLKANGVGTSQTAGSLPEGTTGRCLVMTTPDAERTMNTFLGITAEFDHTFMDSELLKQSEWLYMEGYLVPSPSGVEAMLKAIDIARSAETKVALSFSDPSMVKYFKDQMSQVVNKGIDLLFCNEEEAMAYTGEASLDLAIEALKKVAQKLVVTLGAKGAYVYDGTTTFNIDGVATNAIDTNGAGDMFAGAFMYGITNGLSYGAAGNLAAKAAASVVATVGPRITREEALTLLEN